MAELFDPAPHIEAARKRSSAVAAACDNGCYSDGAPETAENRAFRADPAPKPESVATVAGVAGPPTEGLPWSVDLARFLTMPCPARVDPARWWTLLQDCHYFDATWGRTAAALGWTVGDAFGSPADPYCRRLDQLGLVPLLEGRRILALTDASATIANERGAPNVYRLYPGRLPRVPLWVAYGLTGGP